MCPAGGKEFTFIRDFCKNEVHLGAVPLGDVLAAEVVHGQQVKFGPRLLREHVPTDVRLWHATQVRPTNTIPVCYWFSQFQQMHSFMLLVLACILPRYSECTDSDKEEERTWALARPQMRRAAKSPLRDSDGEKHAP